MRASTYPHRALRAAACAIAFFGVSCVLAGCSGEAVGDVADGPEDAGLRVARGAVAPSVLLTGELVAEDSVRLIAPNVGVWPLQLRWIAEEGSEVAAGDRVVQFDNSQLTADLERLRSEVVAASNELRRVRSQAASDEATAFFAFEEAKAARDKARLAASLPEELAADQEWARLQLELAKAEEKLETARAGLESTRREWEAALDVARVDLRKAELALERAEEGVEAVALRAPRDGIFLVEENRREDRPYRDGDTLWPGRTVATLPDLSSLRVRATLFDVDDGRVVPGLPVVATLDAFPAESLEGEIAKVSTIAEKEGRSARRAFEVLVDVEGVDPDRMRPGMSVKVEVAQGRHEGLVVPRAALGFGDDGGNEVSVRLADGSRVAVELGLCDAFGCLLRDGAGVLGEGMRLGPSAGDAVAGEAAADPADGDRDD